MKIRIAIFISLVAVGIYATVLRFQNPHLTETELFLKMFGGRK